jgi:hypothetical protein
MTSAVVRTRMSQQHSGDITEATSDPNPTIAAFDKYLVSRFSTMYNSCVGAMQPRIRRFKRYAQMDRNQFRTPVAEGGQPQPFWEVWDQTIAPGIDRTVSAEFNMVFPNPRLLQCQKQVAANPSNSIPAWADAVTAMLTEDLEQGRFDVECRRALRNRRKFGNGILMATWEQKKCFRVEPYPNPLYGKPPEELAQYGLTLDSDGTIYRMDDEGSIREVIPPVLERTVPYLEMNRPKLVSLNPMNVFPTELDRNGIEKCTGVFIYSAPDPADFDDGVISWFSVAPGEEICQGMYPALAIEMCKKLAVAGVPTVENFTNNYFGGSGYSDYDFRAGEDGDGDRYHLEPTIREIKRLRMANYIGQFNIAEEWDKKSDLIGDSATLEDYLRKYGVKPSEAEGRNSWTVQVINGTVLLRLQPSPYPTDDFPGVHLRLHTEDDVTLGLGDYDRAEWQEREANFCNQKRMLAIERAAQPMLQVDKSQLDGPFRQMRGNVYAFSPDGVIPTKSNGSARPAIQAIEYSVDAIRLAAEGQQMAEAKIVAMTGSNQNGPGVSNDMTAKQAQIIQQNWSDTLFDDGLAICSDISRAIDLLREYHRRFEYESKTARIKNSKGGFDVFSVPPEAWGPDYLTTMMGPKTPASVAVQKDVLDEMVNLSEKFYPMEGHVVNGEAVIKAYADLAQFPNPEQFDGGQAPPAEKAQRFAFSGNLSGADFTPAERVMAWEEQYSKPMPFGDKVGIYMGMFMVPGPNGQTMDAQAAFNAAISAIKLLESLNNSTDANGNPLPPAPPGASQGDQGQQQQAPPQQGQMNG